MQLSPSQIQRLTEALIAAFYQKTNLAQMVRFKLGENLDVIAGGTNLRETAFNLVQWAEAQERIEDLLIGARQQNPGNHQLKAISHELLATLLEVAVDQLEAIVQPSGHFVDIEHWLAQIQLCSQAVCRIEFPVGTAQGSGFLLGPNIIISNYHVIADIIDHPRFKDDFVCRFDYKIERHGQIQHPGVEYHLAKDTQEIIASSLTHQLDYALLQIDNIRDNLRSRTHLKARKHIFTSGEPLCIIQHPQGNPQKIALGTISQIQAPPQNRILYTTNTHKGSSGSPCINSDGIVVALHQGNNDEESNKGIPFSAILADLQHKNLWSVLSI